MVPEASHEVVPPPVVLDVETMLIAVDLDDDHCFETGEVGEVGADRNLAPELAREDLTVSKLIPEPALGLGHLTPEFAGTTISDGAVALPLRVHVVGTLRAK